MSDHLCPVCGGYGISFRDKLHLRLFGQDLTCSVCGTKLTVDYWDSLVALVPLFVSFGIGFLFGSLTGLIACVLVGFGVSWWWSIRKVPLVPAGHRKIPRKR